MHDLEKRILLAQKDKKELNHFLSDYLSFIKKQISTLTMMGIEYEDMLSVAMLTFVNCVKQYTINRGGFLNFVSVSIKNRIIDESRKQQRYTERIEDVKTAQEVYDLEEYSKEQERQGLSDEIDQLSQELSVFGISFSELPKICPKQKKSRNQCVEIARTVVKDKEMRNNLKDNHRISQTELAEQFKISPKTIEKHRKYIVTVSVLLMGDYTSIQAFLPKYKEVESL